MKRIFSIILFICIALFANAFIVDGLCYNIIKDFKPAYELYLDIYYELYQNDKSYKDKVLYYLNLINDNYSREKKKEIQESLNDYLFNKVSIDI